jgi:hypothetical protein
MPSHVNSPVYDGFIPLQHSAPFDARQLKSHSIAVDSRARRASSSSSSSDSHLRTSSSCQRGNVLLLLLLHQMLLQLQRQPWLGLLLLLLRICHLLLLHVLLLSLKVHGQLLVCC